MMDELIFFINKVLSLGHRHRVDHALGAVGATLVFGILRFANFAHGEMMTLGAYPGYTIVGVAFSMGLQSPVPLAIVLHHSRHGCDLRRLARPRPAVLARRCGARAPSR